MTSVADYNNNPGNLRPKGFTYKGQIGVDERGFAIFENKDAGRSALIQDIRAKQRIGLRNPEAFINMYAPAMAENPEEGRENYKMKLAQHLGLKSTTDPFPKESEEKIADLIASFESGQPIKPALKEERSAREPFAGHRPQAETDSGEVLPPLPEPKKSNTEMVMGAVADAVERGFTAALENPDIPAAAGLGLTKGVLEKILHNPNANLVDASEKTPLQVQAANDAARAAQIRVDEVGRVILGREPIDVNSLQRQYDLQRSNKMLAEEELRQAQTRLRGLPRTYVPPEIIPPPETAEQIASRTVQGGSGPSKWVMAMGKDIPQALALQAENMRKDNPVGGQAIIDADTAAKQKLQSMGLGYFELSEPGPGQLALPPQEVARLKQELAATQAQDATKQAALAQANVANRLAAEDDLARRRLAAATQVEQTRRSMTSAGERSAEAKRKANAAQQRSVAQARSDAAKLENAQISARTAEQMAKEAAAAQPSGLTMAAREAGRRLSAKWPIISNVLGAAGATLSTQEAVDRYKQGDYSGSVLGAIEAALNAASMAPPTSPAALAIKGAGAVGSIGMIPIWLVHDILGKKGPWAPKKEPQKARGGLTLMR